MLLLSHRFLRCFMAKKWPSRRAALCKNVLSSAFRIVFFGVFLCVCVCRILRRFLQFFCRLSTFCTCRLRLAFVFQLWRGWWGGMGGVMMSMRIRLVSSVSLVASYVCRISHRFLRCFCRLSTFCTCQLRLAFVFQLCAGVGGMGGDDVHANAACVFCFFCCVTSRTLPSPCCRFLCLHYLKRQPCKNLEFFSFPNKNFKTDSKIQHKSKTKSMVFSTLPQKPHQQKITKNYKKKEPETSSCSRKPHNNRGFQAFDQKSSQK